MDGMLLFGCNSAGKSSYMKAVGLCVVLAQAGFYVPAAAFRIAPFHKLFTRILGQDDLLKGQSSFATEMGELRGILSRCDARTIILGDEVAASTESASGLAIVAAALTRMAQRRSKFVFATHLHALASLDRVRALRTVQPYHLQITYDERAGTLVYDRRLQPGAGLAIYGLEVARYVGLDEEFLALALQVRRELAADAGQAAGVEARASRYNARLFLRPCGVCGRPSEEVHHLRQQKDADAAGLVGGGMHKNDLANLVPLCGACHDRAHRGELQLAGWCATGAGRQLVASPHRPAVLADCMQGPVVLAECMQGPAV